MEKLDLNGKSETEKYTFEQINPIQKETSTSERTIRIVLLFLVGLFLFQLYIYIKFGVLKYLFTSDYAKWNLSMVFYFFPLVVIPTATILFYMRKKIGWLLLIIFLTFKAVSAIGQFIVAVKMAIKIHSTGIVSLGSPQISPTISILSLALFSGIIWTISRKKIRTIYSVSNRTMIMTISITFFIFLLELVMRFF